MDQEKESVVPARFVGAYVARCKAQSKAQEGRTTAMEEARGVLYKAIDEAIERGDSFAVIELRKYIPASAMVLIWAVQDLLQYNYMVECHYVNGDYELKITW